jgi:hypothetical protein
MNDVMHMQRSYCGLAALLGLSLVGLLLWLGAAAPARAGADIFCVNQSGSGCNAICGGGCYSSVQAAVNAASPGGQIRIADGVYTDPSGTVAAITQGLSMRGGYGQSCGDGDFDPGLHQTVLDAGWDGSVISITHAGEVSLQHLTLIHGDGTGNYSPTLGCGGGIYVQDTDLYVGDIVITDNVGSRTGGGLGGGLCARDSNVEIWGSRIISNTASADSSNTSFAYGGGVYIESSLGDRHALLRESTFMNNVGNVSDHGGGGGIYLQGLSSADVLDNIIRGNQATLGTATDGLGGGLDIEHCSKVYVARNRIEDNVTHPNLAYVGAGGGVYVNDSDVHLTRNTITGNNTSMGGGILIRSDQPVTVSNNLIANNAFSGIYVIEYYSHSVSRAILVNNTIADNGYNGVVGAYYAEVTLLNNLIAGHAIGLNTPSSFTGTLTADTNLFWNDYDSLVGSNAIRQDPLLSSNYHLRPGSPAVDAGLSIPWLLEDLEGNPRPQGLKYDIGAFEGMLWWEAFLPLIMLTK